MSRRLPLLTGSGLVLVLECLNILTTAHSSKGVEPLADRLVFCSRMTFLKLEIVKPQVKLIKPLCKLFVTSEALQCNLRVPVTPGANRSCHAVPDRIEMVAPKLHLCLFLCSSALFNSKRLSSLNACFLLCNNTLSNLVTCGLLFGYTFTISINEINNARALP